MLGQIGLVFCPPVLVLFIIRTQTVPEHPTLIQTTLNSVFARVAIDNGLIYYPTTPTENNSILSYKDLEYKRMF